jgi:rhodanese-related sulfurtransferase
MNEAAQHYLRKLEYETDAWDLNEALKNGESIVVIDARSESNFKAGHLPGARSAPHRTMTEETTRTWDRNALYVVYCDGVGCNASTKGASKLALLGFRVKELIGGIDWWKRDGYPIRTNA